MGKTVSVNLYFSEMEWHIARTLGIDVVETCRQSIKDEMTSRTEIRDIVTRTENIIGENQRLRSENEKLREQIRNLPPTPEQKMKAICGFGYR